jgi:thioesterase domain-containing protein
MIYGTDGRDLVVDTFLLSCRVLARGVEHAMIRELGAAAQLAGLARVSLPFVPTAKNLPAARFLQSLTSAAIMPLPGGGTSYLLPAAAAAGLAHVAEGGAADLPADDAPRAKSGPAADPGRSARWNRIARELDTPEKLLARLARRGGQARSLPEPAVAPRTEMERRLAAIWREELHLAELGVRDDYFALGGTSLVAVTICARIERELGKRFPLAALVESPTIEALAARLDVASESRSIVPLNDGGGRLAPLFLVHDADGETLLYRNLARRLGGERAVYGLQPLGRDDTPIVHTRIADMAAHYVSEIRKVRPHGPYLLGGLCAGATVAYEMARQLAGMGEEARLIALFDAADVEAPRRPHRHSRRRLERLKEALAGTSLAGSARAIASKAQGFLRYEVASRARRAADRLAVTTLRFCLPRGLPLPPWARGLAVRTVYSIAEAEYRPDHVVDQEIVLFRATTGEGNDEPFVRAYADPLLGWARRTSKGVRAIDVAGGHGSMLQEPHVAEMASFLREYLSGPHFSIR